MTNYYYVAGTKRFLLSEEPLEEILREKVNHYKRNNKNIDFWLIDNINLLQNEDIFALEKQLGEPIVVLISSDYNFINWIKLRIEYVKLGQLDLAEITSLNSNKNLLEIIYH
uniref:hypothetical protein n=1 Tax=Pulvinaster venetus TaxID=427767 RepID=UPI001FCCF29C|nr:hypothetical protein MW436_pgp004 [Pulvinaster venetus]UNJ17055.1 hypothetical protein [Pulvinaster venetus]